MVVYVLFGIIEVRVQTKLSQPLSDIAAASITMSNGVYLTRCP
jgi:hypothetical protein